MSNEKLTIDVSEKRMQVCVRLEQSIWTALKSYAAKNNFEYLSEAARKLIKKGLEAK